MICELRRIEVPERKNVIVPSYDARPRCRGKFIEISSCLRIAKDVMLYLAMDIRTVILLPPHEMIMKL
jgi:hypothetical protein